MRILDRLFRMGRSVPPADRSAEPAPGAFSDPAPAQQNRAGRDAPVRRRRRRMSSAAYRDADDGLPMAVSGALHMAAMEAAAYYDWSEPQEAPEDDRRTADLSARLDALRQQLRVEAVSGNALTRIVTQGEIRRVERELSLAQATSGAPKNYRRELWRSAMRRTSKGF